MIISREKISLKESQRKLVNSGWGIGVADNTVVERIRYSSGKIPVNGYLAMPTEIQEQLPLIIWNRGGNRDEGAIDNFLASGILGEIASWGYVVLSSEYRKDETFGGDDVCDVLSLIELAETLEFCDAQNIGMEGWSRGGMMAYRVLTMTNKIRCAIVVAGISNMLKPGFGRSILENVYGEYFRGEDAEEKLRSRSAVKWHDELNRGTAMLLIHGDGDRIVPHTDSLELYELLKDDNEMTIELMIIEGGDHYLRKFREEVSDIRRKWFGRFLKNELN